MKMKKTQSLKLMLLGLFSLVSTGAWAQYTAVKGVVYGLNETSDGAVVVGVVSNKLTTPTWGGEKAIEIENAVEIKGATYDVVDFDKNWKTARVFKNDPVSGTAGSAPADPGLNDGSTWTPVQGSTTPTSQSVYTTVDATQIPETLELIIRATGITEIAREDVDGLAIASFVIGGNCGITEIPENLFAATTMVREENPDNAANKAAWDAAQAVIDGYNEYLITGGQYNGQQVYIAEKNVGLNRSGNPIANTRYFIVPSNPTEKRNGEFCNPAYELTYDANKQTASAGEESWWTQWVKVDGNNLMVFFDGKWKVAATAYTGNDFAKGVKGLQKIYDDAVTDEANKKADYEAKLKAYETAVANKTYPNNAFTEAQLDRKAKAEALQAAINAIKGKDCFATLQQEVQTQLGTAVTDITEWFCAYALANNLVQTSCDWTEETNNLVKAYYEFYKDQVDNNAIPAQKITAYKFTSFGATAVNAESGIVATNDFTYIFPSQGVNFTQYGIGLVADQTADVDAENADAIAKGFCKVKVLTNTPDDANNSFKDKVFYVKIDPTTKTINPDSYYVLYMKNPAWGNPALQTPSTQEFIPVAEVAHDANPGTEYTATAATLGNFDVNGFGTLTLTLSATGESDRTSTIENVKRYEYTDNAHKIKVGDDYIDIDNKFMTADGTSAWVYAIGNVYKLNKPTFTQEGSDWVAEATLVKETVGATPATYDMVMCVKIGASQDYVLVPQPGINPDIAAAYPGNDIEKAIAAATPQTADQLQTAVDNAEAAKNAAYDAWQKAKNETTPAAKTDLTNAETKRDNAKKFYEDNFYVNNYLYNKDGKNEVLEHVAFNNGLITSIGDHAFANCVNAKFSNGTFPAPIEYVGTESFLNTQLADADFSTATSENLTIKNDAFKGTPLETLKLKGTKSTKINPANIKAIVTSLKKTERNFAYSDACDNQHTAAVQNTLTTVTLPEGLTGNILAKTFQNCIKLATIEIPAGIEEIQDYAFDGCVALSSVKFANTESQLTSIGEYAFRGTQVVLFQLREQENLTTIGDYAFADNCKLKAVNLSNTQVTRLYANTFDNDGALYRVVFNEAMETLDEGLFRDNVLEDLNLANTQVQQLNDLFYAGTGYDGEGNQVQPAGMPNSIWNNYKENHLVPNETLKTVELPTTGTLTHIKSFALQSLKKLESIVVPSSVTNMGQSVFMNDVALKKATFEDTPMSGLQSHTFAQCSSLEEVVFTSTEGVTPSIFGADPTTPYVLGYEPIDYTYSQGGYGFGDNLFFASNTQTNAAGENQPVVTVSMDDYLALKGTKFYLEHYSTLKCALSKIELGGPIEYNGVQYYWKTYKSPYGTWIKANQGTDVFTAYEDGDNIVLYPAKIRGGYYKIAAYNPEGEYRLQSFVSGFATAAPNLDLGNDDASVCIIRSTNKTIEATADYDASPLLLRNGDLKVQSTLDLENQLMAVQDDILGNSAINFYVFGKKDGKLTFKHITNETTVIENGDICLMTLTDKGLESRDIVIVEPDEATAVQGVKEYLEGVKSGAIYNLQGVRVSATQKGKMYIQGGKKFIQK